MAGGKGTRLLAVTNDEIPKPLAKVNGKPILQWQIECLERNGIRDICIVIGHLGDKIREALGDGDELGVILQYFEEETPLGTAGALAYLSAFVDDEAFILAYGDCIFDIDIARMVKYHRERNALATLFAHPNSHPYDSDLLILDNNGKVNGYVSKAATRDTWCDNMVNAGFYILSPEVCIEIQKGQRVDLEKDYLFPKAAQGGVYGYVSTEYIKDAGTPDRILSVAKDLEKGVVAARNLNKKQSCIFLDRDGTINTYNGFISDPESIELLPMAAQAIKKINTSGYLTVVATNQSVVARGMCDIGTVDEIHRKMKTLLGDEGAYIDALFFCPHHPDKGYPEENPAYKIPCECRKPGIRMINDAADSMNIDLAASWMIGDTTRDIQTAKNAGMRSILLRTGEAGNDAAFAVEPDMVCDDILQAVAHIIDEEKMDYRDSIKAYLQKEIEVIQALDIDAINDAMNLLVQTFEQEKNIYIFGNGGSAATASHIANDFNKGISEYTVKKFRFICLNDNVPTVMAIANDIGYEEIFRFQLNGRLSPGDLVVAISGSGNSPNVINAVEYAKSHGNKVIGFTGYGGGKLKPLSNISLHAPVDSMQITEDIHMMFDHLMMTVLGTAMKDKPT